MLLFQQESDRIYAEENGRLLAEVCFPVTDGVADICHTFVDDSLRGQGIAAKLLEKAAESIRSQGLKAEASCSYAAYWFDLHPEQQDILK